MRIRKHALKILGTASPLQPPQSPPPLLVGVSSSGYICMLNQSPWDVFPSPPPHTPQEEGWLREAIKEKQPIFAVTGTTVVPGGQMLGVEEVQCKPNPALTAQKSKKAKGKRVTVKKENGNTSRAAAPAYPCKKTDGKQWRCKQLAHKPNSLCHYHLAQTKSYSYKVPLVAKVPSAPKTTHLATSKSTQKKRIERPTATSAVSEIYYYSSFGPWRGKQRDGEDISQHRPVVATADEESDSKEESFHYMDVSDDHGSSEDSKLEDKQYTDPLMGSRKKRTRKPVKSRSLQSLL